MEEVLKPQPQKHVLEVLYEDEEYVVVSKPSGLLTIPDRHNDQLPCLQKLVSDKFGKVFVVHRLDRDTSGAICFARTEAAHKFLSAQFLTRTVEKYYNGLVHGRLMQPSGVVEAPLMEHPVIKGKMVVNRKGKHAISEYEVIGDWGLYSLVKVKILTGRTHQIRVHMQHLGHAIVCDPLYGTTQPVLLSGIKRKFKLSGKDLDESPLLSRLALHSSTLKFTTEAGKVIEVEAPLPKDMRAVVSQLNKWAK
jgi:23S rRNA pseudouridine955/2504/2580 synthase/23S rRNA pseudouridine1911/1915/1917 synthase